MNDVLHGVHARFARPALIFGLLAIACSSNNPAPSPGAGGDRSTGGTAGTSTSGQAGIAGTSMSTGVAGTSALGGASGTAGDGPGGAAAGGGASSNAGASGSSSSSGPGCSGKTYKLCEDFESGAVGGIPTGWTALTGYGSAQGVGLANDQAHSGRMALKSDSSTPGQSRIEKSLADIGATATQHFGRIFYQVQAPAPIPGSGVIHFTLTALEGTTENRVLDTVEGVDGTRQFLFNIPDDSCCTSSAYDYRFDDAWHCAEWKINVAEQSYQFWTDGSEVTSLAFTGNAGAKMSNYTSIAVGAIFYQTPPSPFVVWFDDLALDDTRIGCN